MAISKKTLDILSYFYMAIAGLLWIGTIYVTLTGKYLDEQGRPILAIVGGLIGLGALFWMFYVRWFINSSQFSYPTWPPYLSTCPDYMTYLGKDPTTGSALCVDFIGVARRGGLEKSSPTNPPPPTDQTRVFKTNPNDNNNTKCNAAIGRGLSWAGITAGMDCA
jgi:hypothetical protein